MTSRFKAATILYFFCELATRGFSSPLLQENATNCGTRSSEVPPANWPFQVALYYTLLPYRVFYMCGGTIVGERFVLAAAHCVVGQRPGEVINETLLTIHAGVHDLDRDRNFSTFNVASVVIHPEYNYANFDNDVAVLKLAQVIPYSGVMQPACLWPAEDSSLEGIERTVATAIGWGKDEREKFSAVLREKTQPIASMQDCSRQFAGWGGHRNQSIVCACTEVCSGSGGSGLYVKHEERLYLRGIVSFGPTTGSGAKCGVNTLTAFVNIAKYTAWIEMQMDDDDGAGSSPPVTDSANIVTQSLETNGVLD